MQYGGQHQPQVVVLDNGAGTVKLGFEGEPNPRLVFPNCTAKAKGERQVYVGQQLLEARELGGMVVRRPIDRGFLVNLDLQRDIWAKGFNALAATSVPGSLAAGAASSNRSKAVLEYRQYSLCLTEAVFNFEAVRTATEEIVFEEFGFNSLLAAPAPFYTCQYVCRLPVMQPTPVTSESLPPQAIPWGAIMPPGPDPDSCQGLSAAAVAAATAAKAAGAGIVVDAGFSSSYVVPFYDGQMLHQGIRRLNLGGKALTNLLKETVSYRSLDMRDEGLLMEQLKEQLCWISQDVLADLRVANPAARSPHKREVVLPDGVHNLRGYVRPPHAQFKAAFEQDGKFSGVKTGPWPVKPQHLEELAAKEQQEAGKGKHTDNQQQQQQAGPAAAGGGGKRGGAGPAVVEQVLQLNNELFMTPEALFRPSDIGLNQAGLPEVVTQAVAACPPGLAPLLYGQVWLTGGCVSTPGFVPRFERELRALVPDELELNIFVMPDPELTAWRGASAFATMDAYWQCVKTRKQYNEQGAGRRDR